MTSILAPSESVQSNPRTKTFPNGCITFRIAACVVLRRTSRSWSTNFRTCPSYLSHTLIRKYYHMGGTLQSMPRTLSCAFVPPGQDLESLDSMGRNETWKASLLWQICRCTFGRRAPWIFESQTLPCTIGHWNVNQSLYFDEQQELLLSPSRNLKDVIPSREWRRVRMRPGDRDTWD